MGRLIWWAQLCSRTDNVYFLRKGSFCINIIYLLPFLTCLNSLIIGDILTSMLVGSSHSNHADQQVNIDPYTEVISCLLTDQLYNISPKAIFSPVIKSILPTFYIILPTFLGHHPMPKAHLKRDQLSAVPLRSRSPM